MDPKEARVLMHRLTCGKLSAYLDTNEICLVAEYTPCGAFLRKRVSRKRWRRTIADCKKWHRRLRGVHWLWEYVAKNDAVPTDWISFSCKHRHRHRQRKAKNNV